MKGYMYIYAIYINIKLIGKLNSSKRLFKYFRILFRIICLFRAKSYHLYAENQKLCNSFFFSFFFAS